MRLGRCPVCHAHLHPDALVQATAMDDSKRAEVKSMVAELAAKIRMPK